MDLDQNKKKTANWCCTTSPSTPFLPSELRLGPPPSFQADFTNEIDPVWPTSRPRWKGAAHTPLAIDDAMTS